MLVCAGVGCGLWVEKQELETGRKTSMFYTKPGKGRNNDSIDCVLFAV